MRKFFLLILCLAICSSSYQQQHRLFESTIHLTALGTAFEPQNPTELLNVVPSVSSLLRCSMLCNQNRQCRTFDYDQSPSLCRLFQTEFADGTVRTISVSLSSRIGAILYNTTTTSQFYSFYNQTCDHCSSDDNRYLECVNSTCQCPSYTYWNGVMCVNQLYNGSNCSSMSACRQDFNLTCSIQTNRCITKQMPACNSFTLQQPPSLYTTGVGPQSAISADFNKDGHWDLAITNYNDATVSILLGIGNGSFRLPQITYPSNGSHPYWLVSDDFNRDGNVDIALCNEGTGTIAILLGLGNGSFQLPVKTFASGGSLPSAIVATDVNNDNKTDLVVTNTGSDIITIFLGNGNGTFLVSGISYATNPSPSSLAVGDFDVDGNMDLAVVSRGNDQLCIFIGFGNGSFWSNYTYTTDSGPYSVRAADLTGDSKLDLAVANFYSNTISIFVGTGTGQFIPAIPPTYPTGSTGPIDITIQDLNGDSRLDIAVVNQVGNNVTVYLRNGNGTFGQGTLYSSMGQKLQSIIAQDFNEDGRYDLAVTNQNNNTIAILFTQCP